MRPAPDLEPHRYDEFVSGFAHYLEVRGIPRAAGRIFAYLLVCEPAEQTAAQLEAATGSSRGTISSMTHVLMRMGLIERVSRRGERQAVYRTSPSTIDAVVAGAVEPTRRARELTGWGLDLMSARPAAARARLQELHDVYQFFEASLPALLDRWATERAQEQQ
jgi:DNA-binding transcriptional regulator GbsR (MarR family)